MCKKYCVRKLANCYERCNFSEHLKRIFWCTLIFAASRHLFTHSESNNERITNGLRKNSLDFSNKILMNSDFSNRDLTRADFSNSIMKNCSFSNSNLSLANFENTDLYKACFDGSTLYSTQFRNADITRATFHNAKLYGIKINNVDVSRTRFDRYVYDNDKTKERDIYQTLKTAFKSHGQMELAAHYYYLERVARRKCMKYGFKRAIDYLFLDKMIGYGEKPFRTILVLIITIITFFAILLMRSYSTPNISYWDVFLTSISMIFIGGAIGSASEIPNIVQLGGVARIIGYILISISLIGFSRKIVRD